MFQQPLDPLAGVRVLDLSRYLPGPWLTRVLRDLGAEVIKVEPPGGDGLRYLPPHRDGMGTAFAALNAGKRSVVVDLKKAEGQALLLELVGEADVLVESFRPGKLASLGLDPEVLIEAHSRLIVCSVSGYGQHSLRAGHDLDYVARAGVLGLFGPKDRPPVVPGVQIADMSGALHAAIGILGALMEREKTGRGRWLDVSLTRSAVPFAIMALAGQVAGRGEGMLTGGAPGNRVYVTADGQHMAFAALEVPFFQAFCTRVERNDLAHFSPWDPVLGPSLEALFAEKTRAEWVALLEGLDVCCEPLVTTEAALADPEVAAVHDHRGGFRVLRSHVGGAPAPAAGPPPKLGEHSVEVARELAPNSVEAALAAGALS